MAAPGEGGRRGGVGTGEGGWRCWVRGRRDRPRPGSRRAEGSGCPLSPSSAPSRRHLLPSHRRVLRARVRNVTGGSRREGTDPGGGTGTRLPPPSVAGGRGGGQGGEGRGKGRGGSRAGPGPGKQGPGAPATRAPLLPPRRCAQAGAPARRPLVTDSASPGPPVARSSTSPTAIPLHLPDPLCCPELGPQRCQALEPVRSEHACGTPGRPGVAEAEGEAGAARVPQFTSPGVPHSPVHYSLPHPLLHPGRDPFLRPRKRKLRVAGEGRVGVGKSAGKEGGARKVLEC